MPKTKVDLMWEDLKQKGYFTKDKQTFDNYFFAPGAQGYKNRKAIYDDLHDKGYLESPTYEDFAQRIGLKAVSKSGSSASSRPARTTSQPQRTTQKPARAQQPNSQSQRASQPQVGVVASETGAPVYFSGDGLNDAIEVARQDDRARSSAGANSRLSLDHYIEMENMFANGRNAINQQAEAYKKKQKRQSSDPLKTSRFKPDWSGKTSNKGITASGVKRGENRYNAESGELEPTYVDEYGNEYGSLGEANIVQTEINEQNNLYDRLDKQLADIYEQEATRAEEARNNIMNSFPQVPEAGIGAAIVGEQEFRRADPIGSTTRRLMSESPEVRKYLQQMTDYYVKNGEEPAVARQHAAEGLRNSVRNHAMQRMMPGNDMSYVLLKAFSSSFPGLITRASITAGGNEGNGEYDNIAAGAMDQYEKKKASSTAKVLGAVSPLVVDIATGGFALPSLAGSAAGSAVTRLAGSVGARVLGIGAEAGARRVAENLGVKLLAASIGGAVNFGVYNTQSTLLGGIAAGNVDGDEIGKEAWRGVKNGFVFGTVGGLMGKFTGGLTGKAALAGEAATIAAEGGTFVALDAMEGKPITAESVATSFGMALGGRAGHPAKYINNMLARYRGEVGPVQKVRLSDEMYDALKNEYPAIAHLLKDGSIGDDLRMFVASKGRKGSVSNLDAMERQLERMKNDKHVPWEVVRMAEWVLDGKVMPEPMALGFRAYQDENGRWRGVTVDQNSRTIARYDLGKSEKRARKWEKAMLNTTLRNQVVIAEGMRHNQTLADALNDVLGNIVDKYVQEGVVKPEDRNKFYNGLVEIIRKAQSPDAEKTGEDTGITTSNDLLKDKGEQGLLKEILDELESRFPEHDLCSQVKAEILGQQGINVDEVLKKNPSRLTSKERAALNYYLQEIMGEEISNGDQGTMLGSGKAMEDRYLLGYNSQQGDGSRRASKERLDAAEQRAIGELPPELMVAIEAHPEQVEQLLASSKIELSETAKNAARDYAVARAELDGVIQRVRDDIDAAVKMSDQLIDSRVYREDQGGDGMIHQAYLKSDKNNPVYIINGNVVLDNEGKIDFDKSDSAIVVADEQGAPKMVDIKDFAAVSAPVDPGELKRQNAEALRESMAQAAADEIDGALSFNDGDEYQVVGDDNAAHVIRVINSNADGLTVNVAVDGGQEIYSMSKEQLQEWHDRAKVQLQEPADDVEEENKDNASQTSPVPKAANEMKPVEKEDTQDGGTSIVSDLNAPMPKTADGKTDYSRVTPERAHHDIYNERGLSKERADKVVEAAIAKREAEVAEAQKAVEKAQKALEKAKNKDIDVDNIDADLAEEQRLAGVLREAQENAAKVQADVDYWRQVKAIEDGRNNEPSNERADEVSEEKPQSNLSYQLSDEVDENGRQFVLTKDGNLEFGVIDSDTGLTPAPILLSEGMITNPQTNDGYGLVHIEARHGDQIRKAGYDSVIDFIEEVAKNYEFIREGKNRDGVQTYMLQLTDKHNNTLMVELSGDGTYWNINTAGIFKTSYGANRNVVYNRHTTAKQPAETVEASLSGEQSGTTPSTSMNAPAQTSDFSKGKDNADVSNVQVNPENISEKNQGDIAEQRETMPSTLPTEEEIALRDGLLDVLRDAGLDVITDDVEGQKVLEAAKRANTALNEMRGWHGSGAEFEEFDHSHMGEGEGAQAYGWGTYITSVEGIGRSYATESAKKSPTYYWKGQKIDRASINPLGMAYDVVEREGTIKKALALVDRFLDNPDAHEGWAEVKEILKQSKKSDFTRKPDRYLYEVDIPDNDGTNYISWTEPLTEEQADRIVQAIYNKYHEKWTIPHDLKRMKEYLLEDGAEGYKFMKQSFENDLGGDKEASELLQEAGFVGIEYPAQYMSGGRKDGAKNYVIFNDKDVKISNKTQFFVTPEGEVYGFVKDGKIYIDPKIATAETPIHEYSHLWGDALKKANPKAWERLKETMLGEKDLLDYVKKQYPGLEGDALINEVFAHYSGRRGAERLRADMEREMAKADGATAKARVTKVFDTIKRALSRFWTMARDLFAGKDANLKDLTAEDFADMALNDMLRGFKPEVEGDRERVTLEAAQESGKVMFQKVRDKSKLDKVNKMAETLHRQWNIADDLASYYTIDSEDAVNRLIVDASLSEKESKDLRKDYHDPDVLGGASAEKEIVIIYTEKINKPGELKFTLSHETFHIAYKYLGRGEHNRFNNAILNWFRSTPEGTNFIDGLHEAYKSEPEKWADEMMAYFVGFEVRKHGWEKFISGEVDYDNEEINNFVARFKEIITKKEDGELQKEPNGTRLGGFKGNLGKERLGETPSEGRQEPAREARGDQKEVSDELSSQGDIIKPGHIELNVATMRDRESRRHLQSVMEKEGWSEGAQKEFFNMLEDVADFVIELGKQFPRLKEWNEREITSDKEGEEYNRRYRYYVKNKLMVNRPAFVKNGEYPWNIDLGTLCTKRESFDALVQIITEKGWEQNLGPTQIEAIKSLLRDNGFLTACDVCFNEARRARFLTFANDISFYWNSVRKAAGITDSKPIGEPREFTYEQERKLRQLAGRNYKTAYERLVPKELRRDTENDNGLTASMARRMAKMFLSAPSIAGVAEPGMFLGSANIDKLLRTYGPYTKLEGILKNAWGSGTPKPIEGFNLYDPLSWRDQYDNRQKRPVMDWFFNNGGMRAQSFTDYHPVMFFDYLQLFTDLAVRRLPIHIYTKVPALIKLFGKTGAKFNMSLVPEIVEGVDADHAGLRPDGNGGWDYAWHEDSFPADEAFKLREDPDFKGNVGTIAVGVSRAQILKMLDDPTIDMIIPFHGSGMPGAVKIKTGLDKATDYQDVQNTGGKPKNAKDFSFNEALRKLRDPRAAAEAYKEWCKKNGYTPKFEEFSEHPNYYKMLEDFTVVEMLADGTLVYHEQEPVVMRLPENWQEVLTESLSDKTMQEGLKNQILSNEELLNGLEKLLSRPRLDGDLRDVIMTSLERALGKGNAISLSESDFFKELEKAYSQDVGQEEAKRKVEVLRDSQGVVYGFADGKRIVLNENYFNAETPMHEFTHIWGKVAQKVDPELWEDGKALLKQTEEWQEVMDDELYSDIHDDEDAVARETLARIEQKEMGEMAKEINDPSKKRPTKKGIYAKIREWLNKMFSNVRSLFAKSNRKLTYDELKKMPLKAVFDEAEAKRFQEAKKAIEDAEAEDKDIELEVSTDRPEDSGVSDEDLANYDAGNMPMAESISRGLMTLSERNRNNNEMRLRAISAFGGNLNNLERLMSKQKAYDKSTVDDIIRLSRMVMGTGFFKDMSAYEVKRLLSAINKGVGAEDLMPIANNVIDVLVKHQLRESKTLLQKLMKEKGSKVDSRGVEVQAGLDISGQRMMSALKDGMELDAEEIEARIADCEERLDSADEVVKKNAMDEYQGLMLAKQWHDTIRASEKEDIGLRNEKRTAEERIYNFSRVPVVDENGNVVVNQDGTMRTTERKTLKPEFKNNVTDENRQLRKDTEAEIAAIEQLIRDNRIERVSAYSNLMSILTGDIKGSRERAAAWREAQLQRVDEIHHNANSDLEGVPITSQNKLPEGGLLAFNSNNDIVRLLFQPLATFEKMMRFFGRKSHNGEGYLFNRYMRGWVDSNDKEWRSKRAAQEELDAKVSEVMGKKMRWSDIFALERKSKYPTIPVEYWDNDERKREELSQGEALSLYMWNKMKDAKPGLRRMGISEEDIETIKSLIDPKFIELADWIQDEFLPGRRAYYNEIYERMFGAPMAAIENYFPIVRQKRDLPTNDDITQRGMQDVKASTVTGNIMKRVRTAATLDLHADAFDLVLKHLDDMEHWAAWAEFNRDINTLRNYKRFKNKVLNMNSLEFGSGKDLWDAFDKACAIVAGVYGVGSDRGKADALAVNVAKGVTGAKIAFRLYTAAKQLLSLPAFWNGDASLVNSAKWFNPVGAAIAWGWAMDNLPGFSKRWQSRQAGDVRLKDTDSDYAFWRNNIIQHLSRGGMWANAMVDGITCAMGARAVYDTKKTRYLEAGYSEEQAEKRALQDAAISYNSSQQSSEAAFVSPIQTDRTWQSTIFTVFRTASMGYQRRLTTGLRNLKERLKPGFKAESIEFMKKQMERDGVPEDKAEKAAKRIYRWGGLRAAADVFVFGFVLPFFWNLGPYVLYLLFGDDDDKKKEMLTDATVHSTFGPIEGLTGGNAYSEMGNLIAGNMLSDDDKQTLGQLLKNRDFLSMPISSDIKKFFGHIGKDNPAAWNDAFNILVQAGVGVNPETFTDAYAAIADYCDGDPETTKEFGMLLMRITQVPQSTIDNLYIDELGMTGKEAKKLNAMELADRYARYKKLKAAPLMNWNYDANESKELMEKYRDRFLDDMQERMESMSDEQLEWNFSNPNDSERRLRAAKAYFKKDDFQDQASKKAASNWKPETRRAHMKYQRNRNFNDLAEDKLLEIELQQAKNRGDEKAVKALNAAKKELGVIKSQLGKEKADDAKIMERYRKRRAKALEKYGG